MKLRALQGPVRVCAIAAARPCLYTVVDWAAAAL